jgi:hypothetical protein
VLALGIGRAAAQSGNSSGGGPQPGLTPVDPGRVDVSPFGLSFRRVDIDLRRPLGFERVYQLSPAQAAASPARPPWASAGTPEFARVSGALTAVFSRSTYRPTKEGKVIAEVSPGTRFVIGTLPTVAPSESTVVARPTVADHGAVSGANSIADRRVDRTAPRAKSAAPTGDDATGATEQSSNRPPDGMLTSEAYRVRRIFGLLNEAAQAESERPAE